MTGHEMLGFPASSTATNNSVNKISEYSYVHVKY